MKKYMKKKEYEDGDSGTDEDAAVEGKDDEDGGVESTEGVDNDEDVNVKDKVGVDGDEGCESVDDSKDEVDDVEFADCEGCADEVDDDSGIDEDGVDNGNVSDEDVEDDDDDIGTDEDCAEYGVMKIMVMIMTIVGQVKMVLMRKMIMI